MTSFTLFASIDGTNFLLFNGSPCRFGSQQSTVNHNAKFLSPVDRFVHSVGDHFADLISYTCPVARRIFHIINGIFNVVVYSAMEILSIHWLFDHLWEASILLFQSFWVPASACIYFHKTCIGRKARTHILIVTNTSLCFIWIKASVHLVFQYLAAVCSQLSSTM